MSIFNKIHSLSYFQQNTPKWAQIAGDYSLLIGTLAAGLLVPPFSALIPVISGVIGVDSIATTTLVTQGVAVTGAVVKFVSKWFKYQSPVEETQN